MYNIQPKYQPKENKLSLSIYISVYSSMFYLSRCMYTYICNNMITDSSN